MLNICLNAVNILVGVSDEVMVLTTVLSNAVVLLTESVKDTVLVVFLNADNILSTASVRVTVLELVLLAPYKRAKDASDIDTPPDVASNTKSSKTSGSNILGFS